jgi:hypothetical protein
MGLRLGSRGDSRSVLACSILAVSVVAALSSVGVAFAASSNTTTSTSTGSQSSSGWQTSTTSSVHGCPDTGAYAGGNSNTASQTAG